MLIAHGDSWGKTLAVMNRALKEYVIGGLKTTIPFHQKIIMDPVFRSGLYDTRFVEKTPGLMRYHDSESEALRLSRLMAEISAMGYNPHVQLSDYRGGRTNGWENLIRFCRPSPRFHPPAHIPGGTERH